MNSENYVLIPFYLDWKFWSFATAFLALTLSQLPPLRLLFRKPKIDAELYRRINITHKIGNPNAQIHLIISNSGGRKIKVNEIFLDFKKFKALVFLCPPLIISDLQLIAIP